MELEKRLGGLNACWTSLAGTIVEILLVHSCGGGVEPFSTQFQTLSLSLRIRKFRKLQ